MEAHLFSTPGDPPIRDIVRASRPFLRRRDNPVVAYLPAACLGDRYIALTTRCFGRLASVRTIDVEKDSRREIEAVLDIASVLYIPGGNTYVLAARLHNTGLMHALRERVLAGLPLVAFSAGMVLCGPNILTTNDMNVCACDTFSGLALTGHNFNAHYPEEDGEARALRDERIGEYHVFHGNPVLALCDNAHVRVKDGEAELVKGDCWLFEQGRGKRKLEVGPVVTRS